MIKKQFLNNYLFKARESNLWQLFFKITYGCELQATEIIKYLQCLVISLHYGRTYLNLHILVYLKQKRMGKSA